MHISEDMLFIQVLKPITALSVKDKRVPRNLSLIGGNEKKWLGAKSG